MFTLYIVMAVLAYLVPAVMTFIVSAPRIAWKISDNYKQSKPDSGDISDAKVSAFFLSAGWPVTLPGIGIVRLSQAAVRSYVNENDFWARPEPIRGPVKAMRENKAARQKAEIDARREGINARERELEIPVSTWED
jgi:hypothetical protein